MIEQSRIQKNIQRWISVLKENGYRITTPRKAVLEVIAESEYAITPVDIFDQGRNKIENLGLVTVYRTLEKMEELGLVPPRASNRKLPSLCCRCRRSRTHLDL